MMALADVLTRLVLIYLRDASWRRPRRPRPASRQAPGPDLDSRPAAVHAVSMQARLVAAGPRHAPVTLPRHRTAGLAGVS